MARCLMAAERSDVLRTDAKLTHRTIVSVGFSNNQAGLFKNAVFPAVLFE